MTFLITGGAGFIGSTLVRSALQRGHKVANIDALTYAGNLSSLADVQSHPDYRFFEIDIRNQANVLDAIRIVKPKAIFHLAAESHVDRSIEGPADFITTNIVGTYNLLECTRRYLDSLPEAEQECFRFIHVSTDEVYGQLGFTDPAFTEQTPYDPSSPYSASKASSDHLARAWRHTYGLPVIVTNCSNNYGPFQFPEKLIPVVIINALHGKPIPVYGRGENVRDWLFVEDHAHALLDVYESGQIGETYNIGGNNELSNNTIVTKICEILDRIRPATRSYSELITYVSDRPGHDLRYAINGSKIHSELGWSPKTDFESGLERTVDWYLANEAWWRPIWSKT